MAEQELDGTHHAVLERDRVATEWRTRRWDTFCLVTPNWQCRLPGFAYDGPDPDGFMVRGHAAARPPPRDCARPAAVRRRPAVQPRRADAVAEGIKDSIDPWIEARGIDAPVEERRRPVWEPGPEAEDPAELDLAGISTVTTPGTSSARGPLRRDGGRPAPARRHTHQHVPGGRPQGHGLTDEDRVAPRTVA
ncbi:hypothetical protein ACQP04_31235 [Pseudonocardia halophobica]|uniref:hypothetical protein n=1 Tax=Pseudonocardia halophobica TaxID=29401 RepID=UPI003D8D8FF2